MSNNTHHNHTETDEIKFDTKPEVSKAKSPEVETKQETPAKTVILGKWIRCFDGKVLFDIKNPENGLFNPETTILVDCRIFVDSEEFGSVPDSMLNCTIEFVGSETKLSDKDLKKSMKRLDLTEAQAYELEVQKADNNITKELNTNLNSWLTHNYVRRL